MRARAAIVRHPETLISVIKEASHVDPGLSSIDISAGVGAAGNRSVGDLLNTVKDQEVVFYLLSKIPLNEGGILETSSPVPAFVHGQASPVLVRMLRSFQSVQKTKRNVTETEGFALRGGPTIAAMNAIITSDLSNSAPQTLPAVSEVRGTWQILEMSSIRAGGPFANLLVELLNRRKIPIDVDAVAITLSGPDNSKDFIVGAGAGVALQVSMSDILGKAKITRNEKILGDLDSLSKEAKEIQERTATVRTLLKVLGIKTNLVNGGVVVANPLAKDSQVGLGDIKSNRSGFDSFIVLSADLGAGINGGASIIFFQPHILAGIVGCQAIGFYGKVSLETRLGASFKVMVFSNSRFITGEPGLTPGTPLPGGGVVPDPPFN